MSWTKKTRKEKINGFINDGLVPDKAARLAFLTEIQEHVQILPYKKFSEYIKLSEERYHIILKKSRAKSSYD